MNHRFLLAQLHLESLKRETTPKGIREALKRLPTGSGAYDKSYEDAMMRIEVQIHPQHRKLAKQVIAWILLDGAQLSLVTANQRP